MRRVDAACHRVLRDNLKATTKVFGLLLRRREHGQITRLDAACQFARREDVELVEVAARYADLELRAHVVLPDLHRLIGQPIDEIGDDDSALLLHHAAERCDNRIAVVDAPDGLTDARVKGLHAEGETVDARVQRRLDLALREVMNASLERDLTVARERQTLAHSAHEAREIGVRERRRRTAAEEHRLKRRALHIRCIRRRRVIFDGKGYFVCGYRRIRVYKGFRFSFGRGNRNAERRGDDETYPLSFERRYRRRSGKYACCGYHIRS